MNNSRSIKYIILSAAAVILTAGTISFYRHFNWYEYPMLWYPLLWLTVNADVLLSGCLAAFFIRILTKRFSVSTIVTAVTGFLAVASGAIGIYILSCTGGPEGLSGLFFTEWIAIPLFATTVILLVCRHIRTGKDRMNCQQQGAEDQGV